MSKVKSQKLKVKIIFMGTPEFGAIVLEGLLKQVSGFRFQVLAVVTTPDKPVGRKQILTPPPVKVLGERYKIPIEQPERIINYELGIKNLKPDLIVVAAYGQILPKEILEIPKYGCLNIHPSLLPKYRGPSPIQYAILNGEKETGVTIIKMNEKVDAGPIIANYELGIRNYEYTYKELEKKLAEMGAELLIETIPKWINGEIRTEPQDESKAIYTKIIKKEDGKINWRKSAEVLEREIRAYFPWPGSYTSWQKEEKMAKINILKARVLKSTPGPTYPVGKVLVVPQNEIGVQCGHHQPATPDFLVVEKLQMEGGKEMAAEDFLRGHPDFIGTILK